MTSKGFVYVVGADRQLVKMFADRHYGITNIQKSADILVFPGGWDINPELYNQKTNPDARVNVNHSDDRRDLSAWKLSEAPQTKVGICRGGQFLNVMNGGKMYQHVSGHEGTHKVHDTLKGIEVTVSSSHHQMMIPGQTAEVLAYSEGVGYGFMDDKNSVLRPEHESEILWYQSTKSLCYQGHPEWGIPGEEDYFFELLETVRS